MHCRGNTFSCKTSEVQLLPTACFSFMISYLLFPYVVFQYLLIKLQELYQIFSVKVGVHVNIVQAKPW